MQFPEWYGKWVTRHLLTFGILDTSNSTTLFCWWDTFNTYSYTDAELTEATRTILAAPEMPIRLGDHYYAIKRAVSKIRDDKRKHDENQRDRDDDTWGRCPACNNTAMVPVPHPSFADPHGWRPKGHNRVGEPIMVETTVLCKCWHGEKMREAETNAIQAKKRKGYSLTLEEYESGMNYTWKAQMAAEHDRKKKNMATENTLTMPLLMARLVSQTQEKSK